MNQSIARSSRTSRTARALLCLASMTALFASAGAHAAGETISSDRAAFVDSTNVVPFGRYQFDIGVAGVRDLTDGVRSENYATPALMRVGVAKDLEMRIGTFGYQSNHSFAGGTGRTVEGIGDSSLGLKWRAMGQRGNLPAVSFIGQADLSSGAERLTRDGTRTSLRMSAEWALPQNVTLGVMPGVAYEKDAFGDRYTSGSMGVILRKAWNPRVSTFVEVAAPRLAHRADGGNLMSFDLGGAYLLSKNSQVDAAIRRGLNDNTADYTWTVGYSFRM